MMPSLLKRSLYLLLYQKLTETTKKVSDMRNKNDLLPFNAVYLAVSLGFSATAAASEELEQIVVTANKRTQSVNDVGLSISAISVDKLEEQKLTSLEDISSVVPGLVYSASTANTPIFTLRGIGFNEQTLGAYPATSLYLDEAPMPFPVLASHSAYDLERVEVLKGPQGILFGQNSTGGAINFISAKPTEDFEAGGNVSYGRFNKMEFNGYVSGSLTDNINARLSVTGLNSDEWQKSSTRNDENGAQEYFAGRLVMTYEPSDTSKYLLNFNTWTDKSDPQAQQLIAINPQVVIPGDSNLEGVLALPISQEDNRAADWSPDIDPSTDREFSQLIFRGDWDLTSEMTLTALTTYQDFEQTQHTDGDGTSLVLFDLAPIDGEIDTWISEIRLAGYTQNMNWVIGANYEKSNTLEKEILNYRDSTNYNAANVYINTSGISLEQEINAYAVFGNIDYNINDDLTVKIGARYTDSSIEVESCNFVAANDPSAIDAGQGANVGSLFNILGDLLNGGDGDFSNGLAVPFNIVGVNDCYTLNDNRVPGEVYTKSLDENNASWRFGLDYAVNSDTLVYGNISKGYKSGSFPALAAANFFQLDPVTQESVLAYELGVKATMAERTIQFNAATFFYEYKDKQLRTKTLDPIFGLLDTLDNVPETEIFGIDADVVAIITDELTLSAGVTYLDSEVTDYKNGIGFNGVSGIDFKGEPIPFTPEWTYSLDADYRLTMNSGATVFAGIGVTGQSESEAAFGASTLELTAEQYAAGARTIKPDYNVMDGYAVWNARLGFESADYHWKVTLWGKNISDEYYVTNLIASSDTTARFVGSPMTYGITVGYTY